MSLTAIGHLQRPTAATIQDILGGGEKGQRDGQTSDELQGANAREGV